jgi:hypothetical protein
MDAIHFTNMATGHNMFSVIGELSSHSFCKIAAPVSLAQGYPELPDLSEIPSLHIHIQSLSTQGGIQEELSYSSTHSLSRQCLEVRRYIQALRALPLGENAVPTEQEVVEGPTVGLGLLEKKQFLVPGGIRNPGHPARGAVSIQTALSRLLIIDISMWTYLFFLAQERVGGHCSELLILTRRKI